MSLSSMSAREATYATRISERTGNVLIYWIFWGIESSTTGRKLEKMSAAVKQMRKESMCVRLMKDKNMGRLWLQK